MAHVRDGDGASVAVNVDHGEAVSLSRHPDRAALERPVYCRAAAGPGIGGDISSRLGAGDDMIAQKLGQQCPVLRHHQRVERALRQLREGLVGRGEQGDASRQPIRKAGRAGCAHQRAVIGRFRKVLEDRKSRVHGCSADRRLQSRSGCSRRRGGCRWRRRGAARQRGRDQERKQQPRIRQFGEYSSAPRPEA